VSHTIRTVRESEKFEGNGSSSHSAIREEHVLACTDVSALKINESHLVAVYCKPRESHTRSAPSSNHFCDADGPSLKHQ